MKAIIECVEEEYAYFLFTPWRIKHGWRWVPMYLRGPSLESAIGPLLTLCGIWRFARKPVRVIDVNDEVFLHCKIVDTCPILGSYGMGGPGFFGLKCCKRGKTFWIVFLLWGAIYWLTINGELLETSHFLNGEGSSVGEGVLTKDAIIGGVMTSVTIQHERACLNILKDDQTYELELRRDGSTVPPLEGSGKKRVFDDNESTADAIIISRKAYLWLD